MHEHQGVPELGDGLTPFGLGSTSVRIDLVGWAKWYTETSTAELAEHPFKLLDAVKDKLRQENGVEVNYSQADSLLHEIMATYQDLKKKQTERLTSPSSTESTPSSWEPPS